MYTLDTGEKIIKAKISLQTSNPFFSYIIMSMRIRETTESKSIPTMGVNKVGDLFYNKDFVEKLSKDELHAVLCHECSHIAFNTFERQGKRDSFLWNIATDYAINWILQRDGFRLPKDVLLADVNGNVEITDKKGKKVSFNIANMCAEEIYDKLLNHAEVAHVYFDDGHGGAKGQFDKHLPGDSDDKGQSQGKIKSEADRIANESYWKEKATEAATAAKMRGTMSSALERELGTLLEPKIDWRKKLYHFITKDLPVDFTMRKPSRRFYSTGYYMPSVIRENLQVLIGIDVSGSISQSEYNEFMTEIVSMARGFTQLKMRVIFWATHVDERDDIEVYGNGIDTLMEHKIHNSGGTEMSCFARYVQDKSYNTPVVIMFTDGFIENDPQLVPARHLFVLPKNNSPEIVQKYGEVCSLSDIEKGS